MEYENTPKGKKGRKAENNTENIKNDINRLFHTVRRLNLYVSVCSSNNIMSDEKVKEFVKDIKIKINEINNYFEPNDNDVTQQRLGL